METAKPMHISVMNPCFGSLPMDILEKIMVQTDSRIKVQLYEAGMLHLMASTTVYSGLLDEVMRHYANAHRRNLSKCLQLLSFHVWDDGTPMKRHGRGGGRYVKRD